MPLEFEHNYITEIIRKKVECGDYGCLYENGEISPVYFERKSISDLFSTLSANYKRFKKEILRAKENKVILFILIEGTLSKILKGVGTSQRSGDEIVQQLFTLLLRYKLPFVCCKDREEMQRWIIEFYFAYGREFIDKQ